MKKKLTILLFTLLVVLVGSTVTVNAAIDIKNAKSDIKSGENQRYTGKPLEPALKVTYNGTELVEGKDYTVTYSNNVEPLWPEQWAKYTITGKGNYTGTKTGSFGIYKAILTQSNVSLRGLSSTVKEEKFWNTTKKNRYIDNPRITYTKDYAADLRSRITVTYCGMTLKEGRDYTLKDIDNSYYEKLGVAIEEVDDSRYYAIEGDDLWIFLENVDPVDISTLHFDPIPPQRYTGEPLIPITRVLFNGDVLEIDNDQSRIYQGGPWQIYSRYQNNVEPGTATAIFRANYGWRRRFIGVKELTFQIKDADGVKLDRTSATILTDGSDQISSSKGITLKASVYPADAKKKDVTWKSSNTSVATVSQDGHVSGKKPGTVTITVTHDATGKKASCKVKVLSRREYSLKNGKRYVFKSRLSKNFSMDVMRISTTANTNVSLYKYDNKRYAQRFLVKKVMIGSQAYYALTISSNGRAVSELSGGNVVQGVYKGTNWQLFKVYRFNDGSVQFVSRATRKAPTVVSGKAEQRSDIRAQALTLDESQRWYGELVS